MFDLRPHQERGVEWLVSDRRRYLADDPGLGKTAQAVCAARELGMARTFVVCPAIARPLWRRNWEAWRGPGELRVHSYSEMVGDPGLREFAHDWSPTLVVLDEAHYCKTPSAKRTKAALRLANRAPRVFMLSGTPVPNHVGELYAPLRAVWPDELARYGIRTGLDFLQFFAVTVPTDWGPRVVRNRNVEELKGILSRMMLRRKWSDPEIKLGLPPLAWENTPLEIRDADLEQFERRVAKLPVWRDGREPTPIVRRLLGELKAAPAAALVSAELELKAYHSVVVLAYHRSVLNALRHRLSRFGLSYIDGETPAKQRETEIEAFQSKKNRVFLGQVQAVGLAIDLHAGHEIVLVEPQWSPEDDRQAVRRVHRIGQTQPCRARLLFAPGTMDEAITGVRTLKLKNLGEVVSL